MGQRVIINVKLQDKIIASVYFHWGGRTYSALCLAQNLVKDLLPLLDQDEINEQDIQLKTIRHCEKIHFFSDGYHGGADYMDQDNLRFYFPNEKFEDLEHVSRDNGMVCFSQLAIRITAGSGDCDPLTIDLTNRKIINHVFYVHKLDYIEKHKDYYEDHFPNIEEIPPMLSILREFDFDLFDAIKDLVRYGSKFHKDEDSIFEIID